MSVALGTGNKRPAAIRRKMVVGLGLQSRGGVGCQCWGASTFASAQSALNCSPTVASTIECSTVGVHCGVDVESVLFFDHDHDDERCLLFLIMHSGSCTVRRVLLFQWSPSVGNTL